MLSSAEIDQVAHKKAWGFVQVQLIWVLFFTVLGIGLGSAVAHADSTATIKVRGFAIDAPGGCEHLGSFGDKWDKGTMCRLTRPDGSAVNVGLEVSGGKGAGLSAGEFEQRVNALLDAFASMWAGKWADKAPESKTSVTALPSSRTPRGMAKCKILETKATRDKIVLFERAFVCLAQDKGKKSVFGVVGFVQNAFAPENGQRASPDFNKQSSRFLATLRFQ